MCRKLLSNVAMKGGRKWGSVKGLWSGARWFLLVFLWMDGFRQCASTILER